jgi:hypothetical protein
VSASRCGDRALGYKHNESPKAGIPKCGGGVWEP